MMAKESPLQSGLFEPKDLGARVPADHVLRRIASTVDFNFVNDEVERTYGAVGHESVPPTRVMKLLLLLVLYNVASERALFRDLPMRIDWLWFLGYDLSSTVPTHSVLSKARKRWGAAVFSRLFETTIRLCMEAGLVDGRHLLADSSLIDANASVDSLFRVAEAVASSATERLDELDDDAESGDDEDAGTEPKYRSRTDPDATGAKRRSEKRVRPRYQTHRVVDSQNAVITATIVGPGHENEATQLEPLVFQHTERTGCRAESLTADTKYGTADVLEFCEINHIDAYITPFRSTYTKPKGEQFSECCFRYDAENDCYTCPAGQQLIRRAFRRDKDAYRYVAPARVCRSCPVRSHCTSSRRGRSINRPARMQILERAVERVRTEEGKARKKRRKWMMEGSFAQSVPLGYKRARARGLPNMRIQDYLVAAVQNLLILLRATFFDAQSRIRALFHPVKTSRGLLARLQDVFCPDCLFDRLISNPASFGAS